jgi:hypothetical protein
MIRGTMGTTMNRHAVELPNGKRARTVGQDRVRLLANLTKARQQIARAKVGTT